MYLDTSQLSQKEVYKILIASVAPRPIAWAGTRSADGINNLAPFSFYNVFSAKPAIVGFATTTHPNGDQKDTLKNIEQSKCFTLSTVSYQLLEKMSKSSALLAPDEDEFEFADIEVAEAGSINAPFVANALLVFECKLQQIIKLGEAKDSGSLILGEITHIRVDDNIYQDGRIDFETLDPVGRLAGNWYCSIRDKMELERG